MFCPHVIHKLLNLLVSLNSPTTFAPLPSPQASSYVLYSSLSHRICYTFHESVSLDRKRVQSRRDAEVVRVKKKLLREYLRKGGGEIKGEGEIKKMEGKESRGNKGTTRGKRANSEPTINLRRRPKTR